MKIVAVVSAANTILCWKIFGMLYYYSIFNKKKIMEVTWLKIECSSR